MVKYRKQLLLGLAGVLVAVMAGCATPLPATTASSNQASCCKRINQYQFAPLTEQQAVTFGISAQSARFRFDDIDSPFVGIRWDGAPDSRVEIRSYVQDDTLFIPNILFMNEQMSLIQPDAESAGWSTLVTEQGHRVMNATLPVPKDTRFILAYTSPENFGIQAHFQRKPIVINKAARHCVTYENPNGGSSTSCNTVWRSKVDAGKVTQIKASSTGLLQFTARSVSPSVN